MSRVTIAREFCTHLRSRNKLFLIPVVLVLLIVGIALVLTAGSALPLRPDLVFLNFFIGNEATGIQLTGKMLGGWWYPATSLYPSAPTV